jgi:hypothetical protein
LRACAFGAQGILAGCWVVSTEWVTASLAAAGGPALLPEGQFEVAGDGSSVGGSGAGAPARGRQRKAAGEQPLLSGRQVFVAGGGSAKESCMSLVKAAGATVAVRLPPAAAATVQDAGGDAGQPLLLVLVPEGGCAGSGGGGKGGTLAHARALGLPVLRAAWLMDSVSCMALLPEAQYEWSKVSGCKPADEVAGGGSG